MEHFSKPEYTGEIITRVMSDAGSGGASSAAQEWKGAADKTREAVANFNSAINKIVDADWKGSAARAAGAAVEATSSGLEDLVVRVALMEDVTDYFGRGLEATVKQLPGKAEIMPGVVGNVADRVGLGFDADAYATERFDEQCIRVMNGCYVPSMTDTNDNMVAFEGPKRRSPGPSDTPTSPGGPGSPSGPSSVSGGGSGGTPSGLKDVTTPKVTTPKPVKVDTPTQALDGLKNSLGQLGGLGSSLANQAQNLGKGLLNANRKAVSPQLVRRPVGTGGLKGGKSPGKGGGGGGAKGAGGSKPKAPVLRESLDKATRTAQLASKAGLTGTRATTSSPMGGTPMGGGRGGGAGGQDKEHKANKFLQTTANGAALLGIPPATVSSVVAAIPGGVSIVDGEAEASSSRA